MRPGWVYILTNRPNGVLYVGVTSDLVKRAWQHREHVTAGFTSRYEVTRLVYFEEHAEIEGAIAREKAIKGRRRAWKVRLILEGSPGWGDLYAGLL